MMDEKLFTDLAVKIESVDARCRSNTHRVEGLETDMKDALDMQLTLVKLATGVENMGNQIISVKEDIQDIKSGQRELSDKVTTLENRPAQNTHKRLLILVDKIVWLFVAGLAGYLFAQVFPAVF